MVSVWPPSTVTVPLRATLPLGAVESVSGALPLPAPLPLTVIHAVLLHADHKQPGAVLMVTPVAPPPYATVRLFGAGVIVHEGCGDSAIRMPAPETRSKAGVSMSSAAPNRAL